MKKKDNHPKPSTIMIAQLIKTDSTLSTTIARQDKQIDKLREQIDYLKEDISNLENRLDRVIVDNEDKAESFNELSISFDQLEEENEWLKNKVDWDSNNYSEPDGRLH